MELRILFDDYLKYCNIYRKKGTYDYYKKTFKSLMQAFDYCNYLDTDEFKKTTFDELVMYFKNQTTKKNSKINDTLSSLYTVLTRYEIKSSLTKRIPLSDDTTSFRPLNENDLNKLMKYLGKQNLTESNNLVWVFSIYLLLDTGVRLNELVNIKTVNVDLYSKKILLEQTKNGRKRIVSYGVLTESLIKQVYNKKHEFLLWNAIQKTRLQRRSLEHLFEKINAKLKLSQNVHAHRLRKTFATRLLKMGCPITTIQKLLGHQSITQTMIYLEIDNDMIDKDYREFYPY